ncbi:MAG: glycosyltransferase family 2 protein [Myxococcota bacterium]|jgi:glycosyltransferase involved in cell wall biosynthesis|nr:glycosyltransferase family 2 protein [Myxococcota bacterium]
MNTALPSITASIRSYERYPQLLELIALLQAQDHPDFEIVVIEQSKLDAEQRATLDAIAEADPRVRVLYSAPLGVGGSREAAWRNARKEIVVIIDDDDLPLGNDFLSGHARNYLDPKIVAVTPRHVFSPDEVCGYNRWRARRYCLRYNFFGYPHVFCRFDERIESVDWVHGSGSLRRSVIERVGGWDPNSTEHDEHPLCMPLLKQLRPGERLVFDPSIKLLRRKHIPGGASVRYDGAKRIYDSWIRYYHDIVLKYRPLRSIALYPIFPVASTVTATRWIWTDSMIHSSTQERLQDSLRTIALSPVWYTQELQRLARKLPHFIPSLGRKPQTATITGRKP